MHIAEGFLPVAHCVAWYAASAPFVIHGARKVIEQAKEHPESRLLLAAAGAFTFVLCWNEFLVAQVLNSKQGTTTLPPTVAGMLGQANIDYSVIAASGFLSAIPAVILALVFQRYMVQGLTAGSVKG